MVASFGAAAAGTAPAHARAWAAAYRWLAMAATLGGFYGGATLLALALFVAAIRADLFGGIAILFYRGIADLLAVGLVLILVLALVVRCVPGRHLAGRDAVAATIVALALNFAAFTLGPVTVDRSVSIFLLSRLAARHAPMTVDDMAADFVRRYVCDWKQIARRFDEQVASGNLAQTASGYRLTPQGRSVVATARSMAALFRTDPRLVAGEAPLPISRPTGSPCVQKGGAG